MDDLTGQRRVTSTPLEVDDWKGRYTLGAGERFTVGEPDEDPAYVNIERDGILSGSMGGRVAVADLPTRTRLL